MRNQTDQKTIAIISAQRGPNQQDNARAHEYLGKRLNDLRIGHSEIDGVYEGKAERSYLCTIKNDTQLKAVQHLTYDFGQDCLLVSRPDRSSYLFYPESGAKKELGTLREALSAEGLKNYSIVIVSGIEKYYTTEAAKGKRGAMLT